MKDWAKAGRGTCGRLILFTSLAWVTFYPLPGAEPPTRGQSVQPILSELHLPTYRALIIGVNAYTRWDPPLRQARQDAEKLAEILRAQYGFADIRTLYDREATLPNLDTALRRLVDQLGPNDALLIYFAGHGFYDQQLDKAYWVPVDAARLVGDEPAFTEWFDNNRLKEFVRKMKARHVLVVCDSCFSGALFDRGEPLNSTSRADNWRVQALARPSRFGLTSGAVQTVPDESIFARKFRLALQYPKRPVLAVEDIATEIQEEVFRLTQRRPLFRPLDDPGGSREGQFVFVVRGPAPAPGQVVELPPQTAPSLKPVVPTPSPVQATEDTPATATKERPWVNSLGMKFVPVPLGAEATNVVLFCIWEARVQDYAMFAAAKTGVDMRWRYPVHNGVPVTPGPMHPVVNVNWDEARAFCIWLTEKERKTGLITTGQSYRLPRDWEWSVAVGLNELRTGTPQQKRNAIDGVYPWGTQWPPPTGAGNYPDQSLKLKLDFPPPIHFAYEDGYATTAPVGSYTANAFGLHDLSGNVWEWCEHGSAPRDRPLLMVLRGGSWFSGSQGNGYLLSSHRSKFSPSYRRDDFGFRVVLVDDVAR